MLTLNDGRSELWQWDTGRKLTVDADCSQVHFSNKIFGRSIDVDAVDGAASIPDVLLQTDKDLTAWAFVGTAENGYTKISKTFKVNKRSKPADYVFTPQDQTTLEEITERLEDLENQKRPAGFVKTVNGIEPDKNGNIDIPTGTGNAVQYVTQTLTDEQKQQARENIGASSGLISILGTDPTEPKEGQMWIMKTTTERLTTPVIELGSASENSIAFKLSNASFDGSGAVVDTYNIYVNSALNKTESIAQGGNCIVTGLSPETEYQISVRGVKGAVLSAMSNVISTETVTPEPEVAYAHTVGEGDCVAIPSYQGEVSGGVHCIKIAFYGAKRAMMMSTSGDKAFTNQEGVVGTYYPFAVPSDATKAIVNCPSGVTFSYNGYTVTNGNYVRTVDSGFKSSGTEVTFDAGQCQYCYIFFSKTTDMTEEELLGSELTFA